MCNSFQLGFGISELTHSRGELDVIAEKLGDAVLDFPCKGAARHQNRLGGMA